MKHEEILRMCRSLARKYNDAEEYEDLVSEGYLRVLNLLEGGNRDSRLLYSHAQSAMNEYYNYSRGAVRVPRSSSASLTTAESVADSWTALALKNALYGDAIEYEEYMSETPSTEDLFEHREYLQHILNVASRVLSEVELKIIHMRYWQDMSQDEVGNALGYNKMWVSRKETKALETICNNL